MPEDKRYAYETLHQVLMGLSKLMAPFTPFMSEMIYKNLSSVVEGSKESVHLEDYPLGDSKLSRPELEHSVQLMEQLCLMGRNLRENLKIKAKIPLKTLTIYHREKAALSELAKLEHYFSEELNIRKVIYSEAEDDVVQISTKANFKKLGPKLGKKMGQVSQAIQKLGLNEILKLENGESLQLGGETITLEDVEIRRSLKVEKDSILTGQHLTIEFDPTLEPDQIREGLAREVIRRIQIARKNADFKLDDRIRLQVHCEGDLKAAVDEVQQKIQAETLALEFAFNQAPEGAHQEKFDIDGSAFSRW